jgi:hypothetical protein
MQLIIFSRLPCPGKDSLAAAARRPLGTAIFTKDQFEGTLLCSNSFPKQDAKQNLGYAGYVKYLSIGLFFMLLLTSCGDLAGSRSTPQVIPSSPVTGALSPVLSLPQTPLPPSTPAPRLSIDPTPIPTAVPTLIPTAVQSPITTNEPQAGFSTLYFAAVPEAAPQQIFPAGTEEIFAVWDYKNMQAGDRIRRIWFRDEQIWLTREENWNWDKYGSTGTVQDISVYDNEGSGLEPARYHLQLYINDILQQEASFTVLSP